MALRPLHILTESRIARHRLNAALRVLLTAVLLVTGRAVVFADPPSPTAAEATDVPRLRQQQAIERDTAEFAYWGTQPDRYTGWTTHSNRLVPVYTFGTRGGGDGVDLDSWTGERSPYRSDDALRRIYGYVPERSVHAEAVWMDQTNIADIQRAAAAAGRKYIFLVVFDGMDWQTTLAAATWKAGGAQYTTGRGSGLHLQDYSADGTTQFAWMVTSPHNDGTDVDPTTQTIRNPGGEIRGGYDPDAGGFTPWGPLADAAYLISQPEDGQPRHAYTDSASSASSMTAGLRTFNGSINVDPTGGRVTTIAHELQQQGFAVGAVSAVPISHATPAAAYAHNVSRNDYQDLTRDLLGLPSVAHPTSPLPGLDVLIGGGFGDHERQDGRQGDNFVPGNKYLAADDLHRSDVAHGGRYVTAVRTAGQNGTQLLRQAAERAVEGNHRLLGMFGMGDYGGHLPFATADGRYDPVPGEGNRAERYTEADRVENPSLAEMTSAALRVLEQNDTGFWLMVEPGDVDWANHDNNIDNSIGGVLSGDDAVRVITDWVDAHSNWSESLLIVTADHGHMLNLVRPNDLVHR